MGGKRSVIRQLLSAEADPSATDAYGWTPLHVAAYKKNEEAVRELLRDGQDQWLKVDSPTRLFATNYASSRVISQCYISRVRILTFLSSEYFWRLDIQSTYSISTIGPRSQSSARTAPGRVSTCSSITALTCCWWLRLYRAGDLH